MILYIRGSLRQPQFKEVTFNQPLAPLLPRVNLKERKPSACAVYRSFENPHLSGVRPQVWVSSPTPGGRASARPISVWPLAGQSCRFSKKRQYHEHRRGFLIPH